MANAKASKKYDPHANKWQPYSIRRRCMRMCSDGTSATTVANIFKLKPVTVRYWQKQTGVKTGVKLNEEELSSMMLDWKTKFPDSPNTKNKIKTIKKAIKRMTLQDEPTPECLISPRATMAGGSALALRINYNDTLDRVRQQVLTKLGSDGTVAGALKTTLAAAYIELLKESLVNMPPVEKISDLRTLQSLLFESLDIGAKEGKGTRQGIDLRILNMDPKRIKVVDAVVTPEPIEVEVTEREPEDEPPEDEDFALAGDDTDDDFEL